MDPNATLKEIRETIAITEEEGHETIAAERLVLLVGKLDGYLSGGGRMPDDWQVKR